MTASGILALESFFMGVTPHAVHFYDTLSEHYLRVFLRHIFVVILIVYAIVSTLTRPWHGTAGFKLETLSKRWIVSGIFFV